MLAAGRHLSELHGIGKDLAGKIKEIVETGHLTLLKEIERRVPEGLLELLTLAARRGRLASANRRRRAGGTASFPATGQAGLGRGGEIVHGRRGGPWCRRRRRR